MNGTIFNIQRFSIHDGPGIRTTVFFKGCPLSCHWCHNPEGRNFRIEKLNGKTVGQKISQSDLMTEILKDRIFYDESGGGVTFSGGEPTAQPQFLMALLNECKKHGIHTAIDTCGNADKALIKQVAKLTGLFLFDLKILESNQHEEFTGMPNKLILDNLSMLLSEKKKMIIRIPLIPGITATIENMKHIGEFLGNFEYKPEINLLPYHRTGESKYEKYNLINPLQRTNNRETGDLYPFIHALKSMGFVVKTGG